MRFLSFSVFQFNYEYFDGDREVYQFKVSKADDRDDTDLTLKSCLPN